MVRGSLTWDKTIGTMWGNYYSIEANLLGTPLYHWAKTSPVGATTEYNNLTWRKESATEVSRGDPIIRHEVNSQGLRWVSPEVGYVDQDEEYY